MLASKASADHHEAGEAPPPPENGKVMKLSNGVEIYYTDTGGDGEVVVLLHSMTGSARVWEYQTPALVAEGYRVIAYSRRGHWGSSKIDPNNLGNGVEDLEGLLEGLGVEKFHGMGTAGGGYYLMDYAVKNHAKMYSMMLACSILAIREPDFLHMLSAHRPGNRLVGMPSSFLELSSNYKASDPEGWKRWEALEHGARYDNSLMQPLVHGVTWAEVAQISCPVMLVAGGADLFVTPALMDYAAPKYRNAESHVINNVGHSAYWEDPRSFNALMLGFFSRHGATA